MTTQNVTSKEIAQPGQYMSFVLNSQSYAVAISIVREINRVADITSVPQTPAFVAGVMNLRGKVISVVDLRLKFGLAAVERTRETCIIVIEGDSGQVGMIVDSASGVLVLNAEQIEPAPVMGNADDLSFVRGMGKVENTVLILVDIVSALSREQLSKIVTSASEFKLAS